MFYKVGGGVQGLVDCCCMMLLDALKGWSKTPIKIVFLNTLLLDAEETENKKKKRAQKK